VTSDDRNRLAGELGRNVWERRLATSDATLVAIEIGDAELSPAIMREMALAPAVLHRRHPEAEIVLLIQRL
jgi:hypothetical protein